VTCGFSSGRPVSSTNRTDRRDITEILLKVAYQYYVLINLHITSVAICQYYEKKVLTVLVNKSNSINKTNNYLSSQIDEHKEDYSMMKLQATTWEEYKHSGPVQCEVYSMQHYVIKFVSDLRLVGGFLRIFGFLPTIKLAVTI
jgi:hypothetical protein